MLTRSDVRRLFMYEPSTGMLIRRTSTGPSAMVGDVVGSDDGYGKLRTKINGKSYLVHRIIWLYHYGRLPKILDHKNMIPDDNRLENLRPATRAENNRNCTKRSTNTSGYKGVSRFNQNGRWRAAIKFEGKDIHIGYFDTPEAAHAAYCEKGRELHGDFFRG